MEAILAPKLQNGFAISSGLFDYQLHDAGPWSKITATSGARTSADILGRCLEFEEVPSTWRGQLINEWPIWPERPVFRDISGRTRPACWLWILRHAAQSTFSKARKLVLIGESLGGAVAADLAARVPVDGIVLQATFTTAWDMAKTVMPIGLLQPLTGARFDSASKIRRIGCPKLFIHGNRDEIVPFRLGRRLYELAAPPKEFYEVPGAGHNDLIDTAGTEYLNRLRSFLEMIGPR